MSALLVALALLQVQVRDEPKDWKLIATEHFDLYYPAEELLPRAREFAGWFEQARTELIATMGVEPPRVRVFLYRSYHDLQQSSFLAAPKAQPLAQQVRLPTQQDARAAQACEHCKLNAKSRALALSEPLRNRIFIHCQASDRWNYWFLKHELAHQIQFEHLFSFRLPSWLIALKDPVVPQWWWEGGADYWAGVFDSHKDQYVRDLAGERLYDLKEMYAFDTINPYDAISIYYEGSYFWRFLDDQYGAGTGRKLFDATGEGLPLASQKPVQRVVGKDRKDIERDFEANLRARWTPMLAGRVAPADRLTDTRRYYRRHSLGGRWSPDGKHLAWVGDDHVVPEIFVDGDGLLGWDRSMDGSRLVSIPSWAPDGKRLVVVEQRMHRDRLLLVDVDGGSEAIPLDFDELYDPAWSPDGRRIAFSALKNGTSDLYVLHLNDRRIERITNDLDGDSAPAWSPDGRHLAWIKETAGRTVLYVDGQPVSRSWALLENPMWSPDGTSIVLAADVGGIYDAFLVDPATGKAKRLTRLKGGIAYPAYHPTDGTLVVTYFEARGLDLYRVKPEPQDEPAFDQEERRPWYDQFKKPVPKGEPADKTRVFGVNWLQFPVTSFSLVLPGVEAAASDLDSENTLSLSGYGATPRFWSAGATVANTRWRPTLGVGAAASEWADVLEYSGTAFVNLPLLETLQIGTGWIGRERVEILSPPPNGRFVDSGPTFSFLFSNLTGVHPSDTNWGVAIGATVSLFRSSLGGDRDMDDIFAFLETSMQIVDPDVILWTRCSFEVVTGNNLLPHEKFPMSRFVRGGRTLEGIEEWSDSVELRFPIWRDLLWMPLELIGLGEWLVLKDLRGFLFGDFGWLVDYELGVREQYWAWSTGIGLRLDLSFMLWPVVNGRAPIRLEGWWALVGQPGEPRRGAIGGGFTIVF